MTPPGYNWGEREQARPCGLYGNFVLAAYVHRKRNRPRATRKRKAGVPTAFVPVQAGSYSAMKPRSLGIVLRTSGHSHQIGDSGLSLRVKSRSPQNHTYTGIATRTRYAHAHPHMMLWTIMKLHVYIKLCKSSAVVVLYVVYIPVPLVRLYR